jgi:hypothetical protein
MGPAKRYMSKQDESVKLVRGAMRCFHVRDGVDCIEYKSQAVILACVQDPMINQKVWDHAKRRTDGV